MIQKAIWLFLFSLISTSIFAGETPTQSIQELVVVGLVRTHQDVVTDELTFSVPGEATDAQIEESIQRLRNLGIFRTADHTLEPHPKGQKLVITVDEKWTLLPIFSLQSGGELSSFLIGAFDVNLLGRYLEIGGRYQRLGDTNSFVTWFYDPRFLDERQFAGVDFWWSNRIRTLYNASGEVDGGYLRLRRLARVFYSKEVSRDFQFGGGLTLQHDLFSYDLITDETRALQQANGLPRDTYATFLTGNLRLGRYDMDNYLVQGVRFTQSVSVTAPILGSSFSAVESASLVTAFQRFPYKQNIGGRLGLAMTSAEDIEQQFFVGGFDTVRGYLDSRFRGPFVWYGNAEYRVTSLDFPWLVLQHTAFVDATGVSDRLRTVGRLNGASTGLGLRIMVPKIYSLVARIDYAVPLVGIHTSGLSFGAQQFF